MRAIAATIALFALAGCASSDHQAQALLSQPSAENDSSYPSLRQVPRGTIANTNAAHWSAVEADVKAAGEALRANPRSQPATEADDPAAFLDAARRDLEEAHQAHDPN